MPALTASHKKLVRQLTLVKIWNGVLLYCSYQLSRLSGINIHAGSPVSIAIEPTTACNLRCPECPSGIRSFTRPTGNLKKSGFEKLIDQIHRRTSYLTFYFQGEPYLNPDFLDMVSYASKKGIVTSTSTNAHFLDDTIARRTVESGLDRLIISIDGTDQQTYESYRIEGDLHKVIEGTKNVVRWKQELNSTSPEVIFQFLVVKPNEHQIEDVQHLGTILNVDKVVLKSAQIYDYKNGSELIPDNVKYSRYKKNKDGTWSIKNKLLNQCWRMWSSCVITWDGDVVPCCFDKDAKHKLGNAFSKPFEEIWKSEPYANFRSTILKGRDQIDICRNCSEGTQVWV
ncbi:MAG: radical SAM/SPASM domain-containing protein [Vicingaceae bacterium]